MANNTETLIRKAEESLNKAFEESEHVNRISVVNLINAEFNFGKFHAYMDMLKEIDFDQYVQVAERNKEKSNGVLSNVNRMD